MGVLRFFLACIVFAAHVSIALPGSSVDFVTVGPVEAVELFFLVSGFYMALVLDARYAGRGSYRLFLSNRALRLFPGYWAVAAASAILWLTVGGRSPNPLDAFGLLNFASAVAITLANVAIVGQDVVMFVGVGPNGGVVPSITPGAFAVQPWHFLLVPQAWSLAIELMFYAIAPLILRRRTRDVAIVCAASLAIRIALLSYRPLRYDPWSYRFFPAELSLFLLGSLGFRCLPFLIARPTLRIALIAGFAIALLGFNCVPGYSLLNRWPLYALAALAIPSLFHLTRNWRIDRYIGELSYPIYIVHVLVLTFLPAALPTRSRPIVIASCFAATIAISVGLVHLLFAPVERLRRARVDSRARSPAVVPAAVSSPPPL